MDNLCHTLAGLALGEAVLKRRTALTTATLVIGANLPDIDVLAYSVSPVVALGFRRGWTHGILAMALWPVVLTAVMMAFRKAGQPQGLPRRLFAVACLAIWSHPLLDLLNTYGVRLLMPFSGRWFHGDTLFIIDPWVWLTLLTGIAASRFRPQTPARVAIAACLIYVAFMKVISVRSVQGVRGVPGRAMASPVFARPLTRRTVVEVEGAGYLVDGRRVARGDATPAARRAAATPEGRIWLSWARFPYFVEPAAGDCPAGYVCLRDARYEGQAWATLNIPERTHAESP